MKRIDSLTAEQVAILPEYAAKWTEIGLSTQPADRPRAEDAVRAMYRTAGLSEPRMVWCGSPLSMALTRAVFASVEHSVRASVRDSIRNRVEAIVEDEVAANVGLRVLDRVRDSVGDSVRGSVRTSVLADARVSIWNSAWTSVVANVGLSVVADVGDSVEDGVLGSFRGSVRGSVFDSVRDSVYGQHDAPWLAFYRVFHDFGLTAQTAALHGHWELAQSAGWVLPHKNICWLSERTSSLHRDADGRLHCETGPALEYPDGFAIHAWHGTRVPAHWIERRETVDPAEIIQEKNVEKRAAGAAIIGWPRMMQHLDCRVINDSGDPDIGELIELTLPGLPEPGRFLRAACPRNGVIVEGVPRVSDIDNRPIDTALAAQAWRIGDPQSEYEHPQRRT